MEFVIKTEKEKYLTKLRSPPKREIFSFLEITFLDLDFFLA